MTLRPSDVMEIQTAIYEYEKKYPRRPAPSAETALSWRLGKREAARVLAQDPTPEKEAVPEPASEIVEQECSRWAWAWERTKLQWNMFRGAGMDFHESAMESAPAWVQGVLRIGWWSMVAAVSVTVFVFGAVIGGLK